MISMIVVLWFLVVPHHSDDPHLFLSKEPSVAVCKIDGDASYKALQSASDAGKIDDFTGKCQEVTQKQYDQIKSQAVGSAINLKNLGSD